MSVRFLIIVVLLVFVRFTIIKYPTFLSSLIIYFIDILIKKFVHYNRTQFGWELQKNRPDGRYVCSRVTIQNSLFPMKEWRPVNRYLQIKQYWWIVPHQLWSFLSLSLSFSFLNRGKFITWKVWRASALLVKQQLCRPNFYLPFKRVTLTSVSRAVCWSSRFI